MKRPLVILTGPTAVGKTELSLQLAKRIGGEIISADSMQVYRHMDIGSAKIMPQQMQGIRHYLIDEFEPWEEFHVVKFKEYAKRYIEEIYDKGKIPIIVGGTGFYIQALLYDIDFKEQEESKTFREQLDLKAQLYGNEYIHDILKSIDPKAAEQIHPNNRKRVIRAIEFYCETGERISEHNEQERNRTSPYQFAYFVLNDDRKKLYERIDKRVDEMITEGLVEEVKSLRDMGCDRSLVSMQGLGYKEILSYLAGEITLEEAIYIIKRDTRHFAKRQLTWFKREKDVIWVDKQAYAYDEDEILSFLLEQLSLREILTEENNK